MQYLCKECNSIYEMSALRYQCDCGSPLMLEKNASRRYEWDATTNSLWRYREALRITSETEIVTLGEGMTPISST